MSDSKVDISIVIPLYNEMEVFDSLIERLDKLMGGHFLTFEVILVDDGSTDGTKDKVLNLARKRAPYNAVILSRNFGHQRALSAGLEHCSAQIAIYILDADLQDPPELFDEFYGKLKEGYDVIYAIRKTRKESWIKRVLYKTYYLLLSKMSATYIPLNSGDFSLISKRVCDELVAMNEESRFLRGMRSWVGFKQIGLEYDREARHSGESKYSFRKLLKLAMDGFFNFSEVPVKLITYLGITTVTISLIYLVYTLVRRFYFDIVPEGFTGLLLAIILFGGVQLICLGVLGEYIVRIFFEVKKRPLYVIDNIVKNREETDG